MKKRVLHIFGIMNRGGAELRTLSTQKPLHSRGIHYDFLVLSGQKGALDEIILSQGSKIHYCKLGLLFIPKFIALLKSEKYDVVHSHVSLASGLFIFLAWLTRVPTRIAHFRSTKDVANPGWIRRKRDHLLRQLLLKFATQIVGVCRASLDAFWLKNWQENNLFRVIYNGFEHPKLNLKKNFWQQYVPDYHHQPIIVHVARMDEPKNQVRMTEIFAEFCKTNEEALLVCVGKEDNAIKKQMMTIATHAGIKQRLIFLDEADDVMPFFCNANMMLFPSKWEGLPGAVIEAASTGLPVLGSDIPGIKEIAQYLPTVTPMSLTKSSQEWAMALTQVLNAPSNREQEVLTFKQSPFQLQHNIEQLYDLYALSR